MPTKLKVLVGVMMASVAVGTLDIGKCVFFIWCLKRPDVQQWMFSRSVAGLDLAV